MRRIGRSGARRVIDELQAIFLGAAVCAALAGLFALALLGRPSPPHGGCR